MKPQLRHIKIYLLALLLFTCFSESYLHAQQPNVDRTKAAKKALVLAEDHQYAEAVRLLELAMIEGDTSETTLMDLAGYYRKIGNLRMATALCKPLVDKDRPRPWHLLEVAGMLIDQGRFTDAEPYLQKFETLKPLDKRAGKLRKNIRARLGIASVYPTARLDTFLHNTTYDDSFPFRIEEEIYWSSDREGSKKTSGWTGRPMVGLYSSRIEAEHGYTAASRVTGKFNKGVINTASPCLDNTGDTLYYSANATVPNRLGELNMQLYVAARKGDEWKSIGRVESQPDQSSCIHPTLSVDGSYLYFAADASDSRGGLDLYRMKRLKNGQWGPPDNLGSVINTERHDGFPVAAHDGKLYFASQGHIGLGGFDLFVSQELANGAWTTPKNLGEPINSDQDEINWYPVSNRFAYLVSNRARGDDDIYEVRW